MFTLYFCKKENKTPSRLASLGHLHSTSCVFYSDIRCSKALQDATCLPTEFQYSHKPRHFGPGLLLVLNFVSFSLLFIWFQNIFLTNSLNSWIPKMLYFPSPLFPQGRGSPVPTTCLCPGTVIESHSPAKHLILSNATTHFRDFILRPVFT